jgi:hypothetical protein
MLRVIMLNVTYKLFMLSFVMLSVVATSKIPVISRIPTMSHSIKLLALLTNIGLG